MAHFKASHDRGAEYIPDLVPLSVGMSGVGWALDLSVILRPRSLRGYAKGDGSAWAFKSVLRRKGIRTVSSPGIHRPPHSGIDGCHTMGLAIGALDATGFFTTLSNMGFGNWGGAKAKAA